jgi:CubicO group peptidase (beta-lactamase class C family)
MASLTKVVALTTAMMQLVEGGQVELDTPVNHYIPEFSGRGKDAVTIRHLLTHSSGLPAWRPLYKEAEDPASAMALAIATPLDTAPGVRMVYSDLGAIILGEVVARVTNHKFDEWVDEVVFKALGMRESRRHACAIASRRPRSTRGGSATCGAKSTTKTPSR